MAEVTDDDVMSAVSGDIYEETDPLFIAIADGDKAEVLAILSDSPDKLNQLNARKRHSPLHAAIVNNDRAICELLLEMGADISQIKDLYSDSSLHVAASATGVDSDIIELLLKRGALLYINTKNDDQDVPLHLTLEAEDLYDDGVKKKKLAYGQVQKAATLLDAGADIHIKNANGDTPLLLLASIDEIIGLDRSQGVAEITRLLTVVVEKGADITVTNVYLKNILHLSARNHNPEVLEMVMRCPQICAVDMHARDIGLRTPLEKALNFSEIVNEGNKRKVELLLSRGATFDTWSLHTEQTVFAMFIRAFPVKDIKEILSKTGHTHLNSLSYKQQTCLHDICTIETAYFAERAEALTQLGANVNARDLNGSTPLHLFCNHNFEKSKMFDILVKAGCDVSIADNFGRTALHYAATQEIGDRLSVNQERSPDVLKQLLAQGADINAKDKNGSTPLLISAECGYEKLSKALIEKGADTSVKDCYGRTYADYAAQFRTAACVKGNGFFIISDSLDDSEGEMWNPDEWKGKYWEFIPDELLIPRIRVPVDDIDMWADRARYVRGSPDNFVDHLLNTPGIGQITDYASVAQSIECLMSRIAARMAEIDYRFAADFQLSGSNYEGTKTNAPDEFDFMFKLIQFSEEFEVVELYKKRKTQAYVRLKRSGALPKSNFSQFVDMNGADLLGIHTINMFSYVLRTAISDGAIFEGLDLFFIGENSSVDYIPNLRVIYVGNQSQANAETTISVDIVPCFVADVPKEWAAGSPVDADATVRFKKHLSDIGCLVIPKNRTEAEVQQVEVYMKESNTIRSLPGDVKQAYIISKILKGFRYCPNFDLADDDGGNDDDGVGLLTYETREAITSYMLKTAVLHVWCQHKDESVEDNPDNGKTKQQRIILWVSRIFDWIATCTEKRELTSLDRPWEDLLLKTSPQYEQVPYVLAACKYIKRLIQD